MAVVAAYPAVVCASARITVALAPRDVCPRWWRRIQVGLTFSSETPASSLPREYFPRLLATAHPNRSPLRTLPETSHTSSVKEFAECINTGTQQTAHLPSVFVSNMYAIQNGENVLFWLDCWLENRPLCINYPTLFELNECKQVSVAEFIRKNGQVSFRRWLPLVLQDQWERLKQQALNFPLTQSKDKVSWF